MYSVIEKIKKLQSKKKPNQIIAITYDPYGDEDDYDYRTEIVSSIDEDLESVFTNEGGEIYNGDRVKHVCLVKKNFKSFLRNLQENKTPKSGKTHIGVEMEFISRLSKPELSVMFAEAGIAKNVTLKDDSSIDTDGDYVFAHEICVLATERLLPSVLTKVCKVLKGNSTVNKSCGLHVHLDMRERNPDNSYARLYQAQPLLYAMCPKTRLENEFCKPEIQYRYFAKSNQNGRYYGINKESYHTHRTLEIRIHSGSLVASKIILWTQLLVKIVDQKSHINPLESQTLIREFSQYKKSLKLRGKMENYIKARIAEFKAGHESADVFPINMAA